MEGLDAISCWYPSGRYIPGILPMPTHAIASSDYIDALSDLILNSRLPVGLVALGMQTLSESNLADSCKEGLLRMRRLGVLLHFMNYTGDPEQLHWIQELEMEGIHFNMPQLRNQTLSHELFKNIRRSLYTQTQLYASKAGLVKDLENLSVWANRSLLWQRHDGAY